MVILHSTDPQALQLMPEQANILANYTGGRAAVLAAPGSGKTFLISRLIAHWVNQVQIPAQRILVLTFTEAAAMEFESRTLPLLNPIKRPPTFATIHGFCNRLLRQVKSEFSEREVLTEERKYYFLDEILRDYKLFHPALDYTRYLGDVLIPRYRLQAYQQPVDSIEVLRARIGVPSEHERLLLKLPSLVMEYDLRLADAHFIDYDMMISETWKLLQEEPQISQQLRARYPHILEDEAQDSNPLQAAILEEITGDMGNFLRVGDPNQSIYGFSGADFQALSRFAQQYTRFPMGQSNRASQPLMDLANAFHQHYGEAFPSPVELQAGVANPAHGWIWVKLYAEGQTEFENLKLAAQNLLAQNQSVAVLCRTNQNCRWIYQELQAAGLPVRLHHDRHEDFFQTNMALLLLHLIDYLFAPTQYHALQQLCLALQIPREVFLKFFDLDTPVLESLQGLADYSVYHPAVAEDDYQRLCRLSQTLIFLIEHLYYPVSHLLEWIAEYLLELPEDRAQARMLHQLWLNTAWLNQVKSLELFRDWLAKAGQRKIRQQLLADDTEDSLTTPGVVHILTAHKSKGLEWDGVLMPLFQYGLPFQSADKELRTVLRALQSGLPYQAVLDQLEVEEEKESIRLVYVALTRARKFLSITCSPERKPEAGIYRGQISPLFLTLRELYQKSKVQG